MKKKPKKKQKTSSVRKIYKISFFFFINLNFKNKTPPFIFLLLTVSNLICTVLFLKKSFFKKIRKILQNIQRKKKKSN